MDYIKEHKVHVLFEQVFALGVREFAGNLLVQNNLSTEFQASEIARLMFVMASKLFSKSKRFSARSLGKDFNRIRSPTPGNEGLHPDFFSLPEIRVGSVFF